MLLLQQTNQTPTETKIKNQGEKIRIKTQKKTLEGDNEVPLAAELHGAHGCCWAKETPFFLLLKSKELELGFWGLVSKK